MRGPTSQRNQYIYSLEFPNGDPFNQPATPARFDIRTQVARSSGPGPARTYRRRIRAARRVQLAKERREAHIPPLSTRRKDYSRSERTLRPRLRTIHYNCVRYLRSATFLSCTITYSYLGWTFYSSYAAFPI